mmetsp:Transcript_21810/g.62111  ORF Transcript_21810/g.62111 Transcript_21810/m.62111 type:complete len:240 (+) Transcript_21810:104-823(+)|eukprot:CAMPEP_0119563206 /NCGR_PEP_ID=MMETSP1352-20130426/22703_1 /TAXON_ID=265584 /ORGANISM="Stauroneis constricta, Strain CCMP1120" /LENGTH=239 /DNA_ID=CAMNT_0007611753 /DNA_START=31 /DNA_END=750 /DNA_ORIENTATION=-
MSGRGRGRGRGRGGPPSGARLLLQRSAKEAGLDDKNLRSLQDITKPQLYPKFELHSSGQRRDQEDPDNAKAEKRSPSTVYLINKSREIHHRFQASPFHVRPTQEVDVVRYGKRPHPVQPDIAIMEHAGRRINNDSYFPTELLRTTGGAALSMKELNALDGSPKKAMSLEEIAANELKRRREERAARDGDSDNEEEEEGNISDTIVHEEEEDEEVADYTINHYESEGEEEMDGGDGEATF